MQITINISVDEMKELLAKSDKLQTNNVPYRSVDKFKHVHSRLFTRDYTLLCTRDPMTNLLILRNLEQQANKILEEQGVVSLNEVYEMLGFPKTLDGYELGWNTMVEGEHIDFGIYTRRNAAFINGASPNALLTFKPYRIK